MSDVSPNGFIRIVVGGSVQNGFTFVLLEAAVWGVAGSRTVRPTAAEQVGAPVPAKD